MRKKKSDNNGRPPAFQIYVKDWLTSKKRAVMDLDQQGAYINLLCHCWDTDDCSLPDNDQALAKLSELREQWNDRSTPVRECFTKHPLSEGRLTNIRLYEEHVKRIEFIRDAANAGRASGLSRRNNKVKDAERPFNDRSTTVQRTLERNVNQTGTLLSSIFSLHSSSLSSPVLQKEPTKKEKKLPLDISSWIEELRLNPTYQHINFPVELGKIDAWFTLPQNRLRQKTQKFILSWMNRVEHPSTLVPIIATCLFEEVVGLKNGRLPIYGPCGKPVAPGSKKKLCEGHIKAEQERMAPKPVLPLLQEE